MEGAWHKPSTHVKVVEEVSNSHDTGCDYLNQFSVVPVSLNLILHCRYPRHSYKIKINIPQYYSDD
jgi:hypothetical protein